jgi:hypothetical protein
LKGIGSIRHWLTFHMFVGFMAPLVIAFHAAFQSNNGLATSTAASLTIVVLTGMIGRFLYGLVPIKDGRMEDLGDLQRKWAGLKAQANVMLRGADASLDMRRIVKNMEQGISGGATTVARIPMDTVIISMRVRQSRRQFQDRGKQSDFARTLLALNLVRIQVRFYKELKRIMSVWRVLHVALSLFLVVMIIAHIGVSLYVGFMPNVFR